jgi:hypothetical protein
MTKKPKLKKYVAKVNTQKGSDEQKNSITGFEQPIGWLEPEWVRQLSTRKDREPLF